MENPFWILLRLYGLFYETFHSANLVDTTFLRVVVFIFLSHSREKAFQYDLYTNRAKLLSKVVTCTHLILYSNTIRYKHSPNLSVKNFNDYVSYLSAPKLKFHSFSFLFSSGVLWRR